MTLKNILDSYEGVSFTIGDARVVCLFAKSSRNGTLTADSTPHLHSEVEIHFIYEGKCLLATDDAVFTLDSGTVCVIPPKLSHLRKITGELCRSFSTVVRFEQDSKWKIGSSGQSEYEYYKNIYASFDEVLIVKNAYKIIETVSEFVMALDEDKRDSEYLAESLLKTVILLLSRTISQMTNSQENYIDDFGARRKIDAVVSRIENYIAVNYCNNISIENVAEHIGYSPAYTAKIIKKNFGMTYFELITKLKMSYAKRAILETDQSFSEIAESVGYNSYNGFSLGFKKFFGKTPEQVRKEGKK